MPGKVLVGYLDTERGRDALALGRILARVREAELGVATVPEGEELADAAREQGADLVVLGSPHRGTIGRIMLGSVGQALLHGAPVPVATAPRGYASQVHGDLKRIAVAYDGTAESKAALAYAHSIALAVGARLEILTVERPTGPVGGAIAYTFSLPEEVDEIQREALREIDPSIDIRRRTLNGATAEALADACEEGIDLLVVGSRGYGAVDRVLLGSTSTALIHKAPCPVIVVPRRPARSEGPTSEYAELSRERAR